jgi:hypothetical protein
VAGIGDRTAVKAKAKLRAAFSKYLHKLSFHCVDEYFLSKDDL